MASLKCLACGHDNKVGDESCASCSSSLNLRLCSGCEAINATNAERCHSCGAVFGAAAEPPPPPEEVTEVRSEAPRFEKPLPAAWIAGAAHASRGDRRLRAALWILPVLAVGSAAWYFYGAPQAAPAKRPLAEVKQAAPLAREPVVQQVKQVAVDARPAAAPAKAPLLAENKPSIEAKTSAVAERRGRITHTKAEPSEVTAAPVALPAAPAATGKTAEPPACPPGVVALGLCKSN